MMTNSLKVKWFKEADHKELEAQMNLFAEHEEVIATQTNCVYDHSDGSNNKKGCLMFTACAFYKCKPKNLLGK